MALIDKDDKKNIKYLYAQSIPNGYWKYKPKEHEEDPDIKDEYIEYTNQERAALYIEYFMTHLKEILKEYRKETGNTELRDFETWLKDKLLTL